MRFKSVSALLIFGILALSACWNAGTDEPPLQELLVHLKPLTPEEALKSFEVEEGFHLELAAAEPNVADPIAMAFDENGRMYVAEMRDYPDDPPVGGGPAGRVRLLEDTDGDGVFEKSMIFADRVHWPSGIACWKGGVFVAAPPDIFYMKDTTGDGVADVRRVVFTGFGTGKSEDIMNNLKWGLDHWIYGTSSYNGGEVRHAQNKNAEPVSVRSNDFRFHPVTEEFEAVEGTRGDFGNCFDDWGNRFASNAGTPIIQAVIPARYVAQNPYLTLPRLSVPIFQSNRRLHPISKPEPWRMVRKTFWDRWVDTTHDMRASRFPPRELALQGYITGAAGVAIYRGSVYPEAFQGNAFTPEPAGNVVIRSILKREGVTFLATRADADREFIASTDNWFRPVNFVNGPDGCLYMMDMYREVIEDPSAMPQDMLDHIDYYTGQDMGRIYRIAPDGFEGYTQPRLARAGTDELIDLLEHPDSWWRETAHRLLFERQDKDGSETLKELARTSRSPKGRLHALWSLEGLGVLDETTLLTALDASHPALRENAVRLAEKQLRKSKTIREKVLSMVSDADSRVRFQTALTLSVVEGNAATTQARALAEILRRDPANEWIQTAVLSSAGTHPHVLFGLLVADRSFASRSESLPALKRLAALVGARNEPGQILSVLRATRETFPSRQRGIRLGILSGVADGLTQTASSLSVLRESENTPASLKRIVGEFFQEAQLIAKDADGQPSQDRLEAIRLLGWASYAIAVDTLTELVSPAEASEIQLAAVRSLSMHSNPEVGQLLVDRWRSFSSPVRREVVEALFSREERLPPLLDALEREIVPITHLEPSRRQALLDHPRQEIRLRTQKLLADQRTPTREQVLERYRSALTGSGDPARGAEVFDRDCATCHKLAGRGHNVGQDLREVAGDSSEELLVHIIDPNAKVQSNFINYRLDTVDGQMLTGIIARETPNSVTLRRAEGVEDVVPRSKIRELTSMGLSIMPEGLEEGIRPEEMGNLISFIQSSGGQKPDRPAF